MPSAEALVAAMSTRDVAVVVFTLWFWGGVPPLPARYLRTVRTRLQHAKIVVMSDDAHGERQRLMLAHGDGDGAAVDGAASSKMASYYYADHVVLISEGDRRAVLSELAPGRRMSPRRFSLLRHV